MKFRPISFLLLIVALLFTMTASTCSTNQLRAGAAAVEAGSQEATKAVQDLVQSGDLKPEEVATIKPIVKEIGDNASSFKESLKGYDSLTPSAKRKLLETTIQNAGLSLDKLEREGVIKLKSEKARKNFSHILFGIRSGVALLRVVEASLPVDPVAVPSPSQAPKN